MQQSVQSPFPADELQMRLDRACAAIRTGGLDGLVIAAPESIYYLTGLDHWGFFACHALVVSADGAMILVARDMERITVENQVSNAQFYGHKDWEEPADHIVRALADLGLATSRVGLEMRSLFLTPRIADMVRTATPSIDWQDGSGIVDDVRIVKSALEVAYTRRAAQAADAGTLAAVDAIHDGASDYEIAAECHRAMILAGSEYPGFGPFIRPTRRLGEEHTTWRGDTVHDGDAVLLEIGAAYRKYQAPMGRLVYVGSAPEGAEKSAELAMKGMRAVCDAIKPGALAGDAYAAWRAVGRDAGLADYERHHCGYLVGIGFPPSWTGGSAVTSLAPNSQRILEPGMVFHAHSWFTNTDVVDYFISNTVLLTDTGCEVLTPLTPETLIVR